MSIEIAIQELLRPTPKPAIITLPSFWSNDMWLARRIGIDDETVFPTFSKLVGTFGISGIRFFNVLLNRQ